MELVSVRIIAAEIQKMVVFYAQVLGIAPTWYTDNFAELRSPKATLAIGSTKTLALFNADAYIQAGQNKTAIIEFRVADVDQIFSRLSEMLTPYLIQAPTDMPWGNRSLLFKDPEGNLINFFTPVSQDARQRADKKPL